MKHFAYSLSIAGLVASLGTGAFAAADADPATLTCADFTAMTADEQRSALDGIHAMDTDTGMDTDNTDASGGTADAGTDLSAETATGSSGDAGADASDAGTDADTTASDSSDVSTDPEVQDAISACEGNDEALVSDTIGS